MRNGVSFLKRYRRELDLSSSLPTLPARRSARSISGSLAVLAALVLTPVHGSLGTTVKARMASQVPAQVVQPPGAPAPLLARLFTPRQAPEGAYAVTVLTGGIDDALRVVKEALAPDAKAGDPAGSWQVQQLDPLEAFGAAGTYDRSKVARLYVGRRVSVARGPVEQGGRVVAAVTLFSPYPDASLSHLESGTLVILLRTSGSRGPRARVL